MGTEDIEASIDYTETYACALYGQLFYVTLNFRITLLRWRI